MLDWAFYRHSGIRASMHVHCPGPCCITKSVLRVHVRAACPCPYCVSMSILHVHVHVACSCQCFMSMSMSIDIYIECRNAGLSGIPSVRYRTKKKLTTRKLVRYRTKLTQSGIFLVRYRTKIRDAGMPTPALVSSMPMPSYEGEWHLVWVATPILTRYFDDPKIILESSKKKEKCKWP